MCARTEWGLRRPACHPDNGVGLGMRLTLILRLAAVPSRMVVTHGTDMLFTEASKTDSEHVGSVFATTWPRISLGGCWLGHALCTSHQWPAAAAQSCWKGVNSISQQWSSSQGQQFGSRLLYFPHRPTHGRLWGRACRAKKSTYHRMWFLIGSNQGKSMIDGNPCFLRQQGAMKL
jgi:hypothetical protein